MRVWIDQNLCVGNGVCEDLCPEVFRLVDGGIAYVSDGDRLLPAGRDGVLDVATTHEASVIEAAEECPAECIFIEE